MLNKTEPSQKTIEHSNNDFNTLKSQVTRISRPAPLLLQYMTHISPRTYKDNSPEFVPCQHQSIPHLRFGKFSIFPVGSSNNESSAVLLHHHRLLRPWPIRAYYSTTELFRLSFFSLNFDVNFATVAIALKRDEFAKNVVTVFRRRQGLSDGCRPASFCDGNKRTHVFHPWGEWSNRQNLFLARMTH